MDDPETMDVFEPLRDIAKNSQEAEKVDGPVADALVEGLSADHFHHDGRATAQETQVKHPDDVAIRNL